MIRRSVAAALVRDRLRDDDVVVCALGSTASAFRALRAAHLTYYASDPMGTAPALALGLALARPDRRFVLLEGDGDLTMNLGVLPAIAAAAPANLRVAVFANGRYETGGAQPLPAAERTSFAALAAAAGWPWTADAHDEAAAAAELDRLLGGAALGLVALRIAPEPFAYSSDPAPTSQAEDRTLFQRRLAGGS